jgi:hypothetical protein
MHVSICHHTKDVAGLCCGTRTRRCDTCILSSSISFASLCDMLFAWGERVGGMLQYSLREPRWVGTTGTCIHPSQSAIPPLTQLLCALAPRNCRTHVGEVAGLRVLRYPHPALRAPNAEVAEFGPDLQALTRNMFKVSSYTQYIYIKPVLNVSVALQSCTRPKACSNVIFNGIFKCDLQVEVSCALCDGRRRTWHTPICMRTLIRSIFEVDFNLNFSPDVGVLTMCTRRCIHCASLTAKALQC